MPLSHVLHSQRQVDKFFIPTHSSRHKLAVTALYKALLTLAKKVPLPIEITHGFNKTWSGDLKPPDRHGNLTHPVADLVRRTFKRNKPDVSPRTITPALAAGYRALELLQDAQTSDSAGSKQVLEVLQQRLAERNRSLAAKAKSNEARGIKPGDKPPPKITYPPLLMNATPEPTTENPRPSPVFLPSERPRPKSELTGNRVVPHMDLAQGFPFIRIRKPTPHVLSATLQKLINKRTKRVQSVLEFKEIDSHDAELEDKWETALAEQAKDEHLPNYRPRDFQRRLEREEQFQNQRNVALAYKDPFASPEMLRARKSHVQMDYSEGAVGDLVYYQRADREISPESGLFASTVWNHGLRYTEHKLTVQQEVNVARARALRDLIGQERALWQEEKYVSHHQRKAKWEARMEEEYGPKWQRVTTQESQKRAEAKKAMLRAARERFEEKKAKTQEFLDGYYERLPEKMRQFEEAEARRKEEREERLKGMGRPGKTSGQLKKEDRLMVGEKKKAHTTSIMEERDLKEMKWEMQKVEEKVKLAMERRRIEAGMVPLGEDVSWNTSGSSLFGDSQRQKENTPKVWGKAELEEAIKKPETKAEMKKRIYESKAAWCKRLAQGHLPPPQSETKGMGWTRKRIEQRITLLLQYEAKRVERKRDIDRILRKRQVTDARQAGRIAKLERDSQASTGEQEVNRTIAKMQREQRARLEETERVRQVQTENKHSLLRIRKDIKKRQAQLESRGGKPSFAEEQAVVLREKMLREKRKKEKMEKKKEETEKTKTNIDEEEIDTEKGKTNTDMERMDTQTEKPEVLSELSTSVQETHKTAQEPETGSTPQPPPS